MAAKKAAPKRKVATKRKTTKRKAPAKRRARTIGQKKAAEVRYGRKVETAAQKRYRKARKTATPVATRRKTTTVKRNPAPKKQFMVVYSHPRKGTVYYDGMNFTTSKAHGARYGVKAKAMDVAQAVADVVGEPLGVVTV